MATSLPSAEFVVRTTPCFEAPAVESPVANHELVQDCDRLLKLQRRLAGEGTLDWDPGIPIADWRGVEVGGAPLRVTALRLSNLGLTGELSGLLGKLTELTDLRLDGNSLTGLIPSKLVHLTNLEHLYLADNAFDGCLPPDLRTIRDNDLAVLGLPLCTAPIDISVGMLIPGPGTYQFTLLDGDDPLIFDVPARATFEISWLLLDEVHLDEDGALLSSGDGLQLREISAPGWITLDVHLAVEWKRYIPEPGARTSAGRDLHSVFDLLSDSAWIATAE